MAAEEPARTAPLDVRHYSYLSVHSAFVSDDCVHPDDAATRKAWNERCKQLTSDETRDVFGISDELKIVFKTKRFTTDQIEFVKSQVRTCVDGHAFGPEILGYADALIHVLLSIAYKTSVLEVLIWLASKFRDTVAPRTLSRVLCSLCFHHEYEGTKHVSLISRFYDESHPRMDREYLSRHMLASHDLDILRFQFAHKLLTKQQTQQLIAVMDGYNKFYINNTLFTTYPHLCSKRAYQHNLAVMDVIHDNVGMTVDDAKLLTTPLRGLIPKDGVYVKAYVMLHPDAPLKEDAAT